MRLRILLNGIVLLVLATATSLTVAASNPCNPCAAKAKNPCATASNQIDPKLVTRPAGTQLASGNAAELAKEGEKLWNSKTLSTNGMSCQTCHQNYGAFTASFAQSYPHRVTMANDRTGMKKVALDEMIQICMVVPMAAKPLPWNSRELAALTAYVSQLQKHFKPVIANPCAVKNPCAPKKNPCAPVNPCASRK